MRECALDVTHSSVIFSTVVIIRIRVNNTSVLRILNEGFVSHRAWSQCRHYCETRMRISYIDA